MGKTRIKPKTYSAEFKMSVIMDMREHHQGAEGLMKEKRGRASKASGTRKGRPPKLEKKVEESKKRQ